MNWQVFVMVFGAWIAAMAVLIVGFVSLPNIVEWLEDEEPEDE
jgi:hypothetical protein